MRFALCTKQHHQLHLFAQLGVWGLPPGFATLLSVVLKPIKIAVALSCLTQPALLGLQHARELPGSEQAAFT